MQRCRSGVKRTLLRYEVLIARSRVFTGLHADMALRLVRSPIDWSRQVPTSRQTVAALVLES